MLGRLGRPLAVAAVLAAATGYLAAVDPATSGHYPGCPFLALTGYYCPGCGGLRAVHDLAHGDVAAAMSSNALVTLATGVVVVLWLQWVWRIRTVTERAGGRPDGFSPSPAGSAEGRSRRVWIPVAAAVLMILFAVLRNLPTLHVLAP